MSSHASRASERARTIPQFRALGLHVNEFIDHNRNPTSSGNRANGEHVLAWASVNNADLLFVEDDIDLASDFPEALEAARELDEPVTFWLDDPKLHPAWVQRGLYRMPSTFGWRGSQALYLPLSSVRRAVLARSFRDGLPPPIDIFLKHTGALTNLHVALPNPVEHRSPASVVDPERPVRKSLSFGMPAFGDWRPSWPARTI